MRLRSLHDFAAEIDSVRTYNPRLKYVNVFDDTFTMSLVRVKEFCTFMKERGLMWMCEGHVSTLYEHPEMIHIMTDSVLVGMQTGIESGSAKVLKA